MEEELNETSLKTYKITFLGSPSVGKTSIIIQYIYHNLTTPQSTVGIDFFIKQISFPILRVTEKEEDNEKSKSNINKKDISIYKETDNNIGDNTLDSNIDSNIDNNNEEEEEIIPEVTQHQKTIKIKLKICDTAGQERFNSMISGYTRDSFITCIVFDLSNKSTLESIDKWTQIAEESNNGNKIKTKILIIGNKTDLIKDYKSREYKINIKNKINLEDINIKKEIGELGLEEEYNKELNIIRKEIQLKCKKNNWLYCETSALNIKTINELELILKKVIEEDLKKNNYFINKNNSEIEIFEMNKIKTKRWFCF